MSVVLQFLEEYKRLDSLCKDVFSSVDGVSEYIRQMESRVWQDGRYVCSWDTDYRNLKHARWVRNKLVHEAGSFDLDICSVEEVSFVQDFYLRVVNVQDPLAQARIAKEEERRRSVETWGDKSFDIAGNSSLTIKYNSWVENPKNMSPKSSFFKRIGEKIKRFFGK